jgi:hypothetical protein
MKKKPEKQLDPEAIIAIYGFTRRHAKRLIADKDPRSYPSTAVPGVMVGERDESLLPDVRTERALLVREMRKTAEVKRKALENEYCRAEDVFVAINKMAFTVKFKLYGIPGKVSQHLAAMTDVREIYKAINDEILHALQEIYEGKHFDPELQKLLDETLQKYVKTKQPPSPRTEEDVPANPQQ